MRIDAEMVHSIPSPETYPRATSRPARFFSTVLRRGALMPMLWVRPLVHSSAVTISKEKNRTTW
jgi:hypothetical protein